MIKILKMEKNLKMTSLNLRQKKNLSYQLQKMDMVKKHHIQTIELQIVVEKEL